MRVFAVVQCVARHVARQLTAVCPGKHYSVTVAAYIQVNSSTDRSALAGTTCSMFAQCMHSHAATGGRILQSTVAYI